MVCWLLSVRVGTPGEGGAGDHSRTCPNGWEHPPPTSQLRSDKATPKLPPSAHSVSVCPFGGLLSAFFFFFTFLLVILLLEIAPKQGDHAVPCS